MSYQYEVFISYCSMGDNWTKWVEDVLRVVIYEEIIPSITSHKRDIDSTIFLDKREIYTGEVWADKIARSHARSKVLVPLICNQYFTKSWCCLEMGLMYQRQQSILDKTGQNYRLILPLNIQAPNVSENRGFRFPEKIKNIQCKEIEQKHIERYIRDNANRKRLRTYLSDWIIHHLVTAILQKPDWQPNWEQLNLDISTRKEFEKLFAMPVEPIKVVPSMLPEAIFIP